MMTDVLFIIQARMGSNRLPGKVLKLLGNQTILDLIVKRVRQSTYYDQKRDNVMIATSDSETDDMLYRYCHTRQYRVQRGSEQRVLDRFVQVIEKVRPTIVVRLTGDNPFVDPELLDMLITAHIRADADYTYMTETPLGIGGEAVKAHLLTEISTDKTLENKYQEHVTLFLKESPERYHLQFLEPPSNVRAPDLRMTVDTAEDYQLVCELYQKAGAHPDVSAETLITLLKHDPHLKVINQMIQQKRPE